MNQVTHNQLVTRQIPRHAIHQGSVAGSLTKPNPQFIDPQTKPQKVGTTMQHSRHGSNNNNRGNNQSHQQHKSAATANAAVKPTEESGDHGDVVVLTEAPVAREPSLMKQTANALYAMCGITGVGRITLDKHEEFRFNVEHLRERLEDAKSKYERKAAISAIKEANAEVTEKISDYNAKLAVLKLDKEPSRKVLAKIEKLDKRISFYENLLTGV